ncbi:FecR domain-containing protein, partial [bacterium]|nr:FecR domain-containing protein [bacterium]
MNPQKAILLIAAYVIVISTALLAELSLSNTELLKINGKVEVKKGQTPFKPVPDLRVAGALKRLSSGDKVKTQTNSGAEMVLKETCLLAVKENSLFDVPSVTGHAAMTQLKAKQGSFLFKVVSGSDFKVQTADVVAGVKGTLFEVEVVNDIRSILQLSNGLEIGIEGGGGTVVNVFDGEVELTHGVSGQKRLLKAGQGLSALSSRLMKLDQKLKDGFGPIRNFQPLQSLKQRFGFLGEKLSQIPSTKVGLMGFKSEGLSMPLGL